MAFLETAAVAAPFVSSALDFAGGLFGNKSSSKEAKRNRAWQTEMDNTKHQRNVTDLIAAGINPMQPYVNGSGPTSVPSGGIAAQSNPASGAASKLATAPLVSAQAANIQANTDKLKAETINTQANTAKTLEDTKNVPLQGKLIENQAFKIAHEIPQILRQGNLTDAQTSQTTQITKNLMLQPELTIAQTKEALARANLTTAQINKIAPEIANLHAQTKLTNSKVGYEEMFSLPGDLADRIFSNSAKDSTRSTTSNVLGSTPRYVKDKLDSLTETVRKQRREIDKTRGR